MVDFTDRYVAMFDDDVEVATVYAGSGAVRLPDSLRSSLDLALENQARSIAFPAISTGVYRFPKERATQIALAMSRVWLEEHGFPLHITYCCHGDEDVALYETTLAAMR